MQFVSKMRILYIVPYTPNPIRVRPYNLIRGLRRLGHDVTVATLWEDESERADLARLEAQGIRVLARPLPRGRALWNALRALPGRTPIQAGYCWQPALAADLARALQREAYDIIHVEHLRGAIYGQRVMKNGMNAPRPPVIWDSVDCISHLFAQAANRSRSRKGKLITRLELDRTRRHEARLANQFDRVLVTSPADKAALEALQKQKPGFLEKPGFSSPPPPIQVLPNGVDMAYFTPDGPRRDNVIVVTGKMSYHANVTMVLTLVEAIMPRVWARRPDVRLYIVGKGPPAAITRLDPTWSPTRKPPRIGDGEERIVVTGQVEHVPPYLQRATLAVAPVPYGAGIQNKVLEAMACGAPVVASPQAGSALTAQAGRDLYIAEGADAFAAAILALLDDPQARARLGQAGRAYVEKHHSWKAITEQLVDVYVSAIEATTEPGPGVVKQHSCC